MHTESCSMELGGDCDCTPLYLDSTKTQKCLNAYAQEVRDAALDAAAGACWTPDCVWDSADQEVCYKSCHDAIRAMKSQPVESRE